MKKTALALLSVFSLVACSKKMTSELNKVTYTNSVTIIDGGIKYIDSGGSVIFGPGVTCVINTSGNYSTFSLATTIGDDHLPFPVQINITNVPGPIAGIGSYSFAASPVYNDIGDTIGYTYQGSVTENFKKVDVYNIDTTRVEVTSINSTSVTGTFQLSLTDGLRRKKIRGSFNCPKAEVTGL